MPEQMDIEQLERLGRVLGPAVREAVRDDLAAIKREILQALSEEKTQTAARLDKLEKRIDDESERISSLEKVSVKMSAIAGAALVLLNVVIELIKIALHH